MASFKEAYKITLGHEGGYSNDPDDVGGETYKGVARRYHPNWKGWRMIDIYRGSPNFPQVMNSDAELQGHVEDLYKALYWDINLLDECSSQMVANEMFDTGVNMGVGRAGKFLQKALNLLNKGGKIYSDVVEDSKVGPNTIRALRSCIDYRGYEYIYKILNILQGMHYINYMTKSPTQEKYAYGWLKRVDFIKK